MQWVIEQTVDLQHAIPHGAWPEPLAVTGDSQAHEWRVRILENGAPAALDGCSCKGYFVRGDGQTVLAEGSIAEAIAAVVLPQACYAVPGAVRGLLRISRDGVIATAAVLSLHVLEGPSDAIVDPGEVIPSLDDLLAQVAAMEALNDDVSAAEAGRVAAEQEREAAFAQFKADIASGEYNGATFTPGMSAAGVLSWTNDKGLPNPESVNIKGADGEDGLSVELRLSGAYLQWRPTGGTWQNLVALSAITGPAGADGADGAPGAKGDKGDKGDTGDSGVYLGSTEPADETVKVWINPDGESTPILDDESVGAKPWSSKQIIDTLCPPLEVAGNPVQCYPVANYPLGVKASWEPRQEGSGDPSPDNVRPIAGMDETRVTRCGKNLLDVDEITGISWAASQMPQAAMEILNTFNNLPVGEYRFTADLRIDSVEDTISDTEELLYGIIVRSSQNTTDSIAINRNSLGIGNVPSVGDILRVNTKVLIKPEYAGTYDQIYLYSAGSDNLTDRTSGTMYNFQLEPGSTPTAYEPYQPGTTATLALPSTVYGGELDAVTGAGMENWRYRELDGTESISLGNIDISDAIQQFNATIIDPQTDAKLPCMCNVLSENVNAASGNALGIQHYSQSTFVFGFPRAPLREYGFIDGNTETYMTAFKAYLAAQFAAGTPVTIAYKLATPTAFQATGGQSLPALPGTNTIYTDADSVTVTGRADPNHTINALNERIAALEDAATGG